MAEETHKPAAATEEVVVVSDVPEAEKPAVAEKDSTAAPEEPEKPVAAEEPALEKEAEAETEEKPKAAAEKIPKSASFKEESNVVSELPESQKKALDEFKVLVQEALNKHEFYAPPPVKEEKPKVEEEKKADAPEEKAKTEEAPAEVAAVEAAATPEEPKKEPEADAPPPPAVEVKEEAKETPPPAPETVEAVVVVEEVVEKTEVDEDGAKTVEAIKETIVEVSAPSAEPEEPTKPAEEETPAPAVEAEAPPPPPPEEVSIWGIPLLADERSDVILLKFLRARDFKVKDAFSMFKNAVRWRKEFGIDALLEEDLKISGLDKAVFMHGKSKKGHPVCYNAYGEFKDKDLYQSTFSDEEKRKNFLKWRIQFLEKSILNDLDFSPTGVNTFVQVVDLKNSPGLAARDLRSATSQALQLLQDNYPELVAKQVFINVPWWYLAFNKVISPFLTQRSKSKFVFSGPSRTAETLFKYIAPELVPVQYGGLSKDGEAEFTTTDPAIEVTIKPASKHTIEFPLSENSTLVWEVRVVGWDVSYGAEFVPETEGGYTVIVQKSRKISAADETVVSNSFKVGESGKIVLTIDNQSSKKKKLLYRSKTKPSSD